MAVQKAVEMKDRSGFVYVIQADNGLCKIGRARDAQERLRQLSVASPCELRLIVAWPDGNPSFLEAFIHEMWKEYRVRGEWFCIPEKTVAFWEATAQRWGITG